MKEININGLKILYQNEDAKTINEITNFVNKYTFLFVDFVNKEIYIEQFWQLVNKIITEFFKDEEVKKVINQADYLPSCYLSYMILNDSTENGSLIQLPEDITKEKTFFLLVSHFFQYDVDKIITLLKKDDRNDNDKLIEQIKNKERFNVYNYILKASLNYLEQYDFLFFENLDIIIEKFNKENFEYITSKENREIPELKLPKLSKEEFDNLVYEFLGYINAPFEWIEKYNYLKSENLITFKYSDVIDNGACYMENGIRKIRIESDQTIKTFITFIHEYIHYISLENGNPQFSLLEFPSIYFENITALFLISFGYNQDILNYVLSRRKNGNFDLYASKIGFLSKVCSYKKNGPIEKEKIVNFLEKQKEIINDFKKDMYNILKEEEMPDFLQKLEYYNSEEMANKDCDADIEEFIKSGLLILNGYQYLVGTILSYDILDSNSNAFNPLMIDITNNLGEYTIEKIMSTFAIESQPRELIKEKK